MAFARDVTDRIIFMDGGYVVEEGTAEQVIGNPQNERTKSFMFRVLNPTQVERVTSSDRSGRGRPDRGRADEHRAEHRAEHQLQPWPGS